MYLVLVDSILNYEISSGNKIEVWILQTAELQKL